MIEPLYLTQAKRDVAQRRLNVWFSFMTSTVTEREAGKMPVVINTSLSRDELEKAADELFRSAVDFWPHSIDIKDKSVEDHRCLSVDVSMGQLRRMWKAMEDLCGPQAILADGGE